MTLDQPHDIHLREPLSEGEAVQAFWDHVQNHTTVMLGINTPDQHLRPMTAFSEPESELIWFFTRDDTELAAEAAGSTEARLVLAAKDQEVFADIFGTLSVDRDPGRIERYWSPIVAAWYPGGKTDPNLTLMCFAPHQGQMWVSKQGLVRLLFQVATANLTKTLPDVGGSASITFRH